MGRENIQLFIAKCKEIGDSLAGEWGLFVLILLAVMCSFGLGRLSALVEGRPLVEVHTSAALASELAHVPGGMFVASRTGETYYFPWCSGAAKIVPANQRWFSSEEKAISAGYRAAKNCKGLNSL